MLACNMLLVMGTERQRQLRLLLLVAIERTVMNTVFFHQKSCAWTPPKWCTKPAELQPRVTAGFGDCFNVLRALGRLPTTAVTVFSAG